MDLPAERPEVVFIGRTNSGKSSMINALFSKAERIAPVSRTRLKTRRIDFFEVNKDRAGLPAFMIVDTPGLGFGGGVKNAAKMTRGWDELIYTYLRQRRALRHIFHFIDVRNGRLLPADKQLLHLVAKAQRRDCRFTFVINKIDITKRAIANDTAESIRKEMGQYMDVDIMFTSANSLRGVDHMWSKIWQSMTETPRGRRHREIGPRELARIQALGAKANEEDSLADLLGIEEPAPKDLQEFNEEEWTEADSEGEWVEDEDFEPRQPGQSDELFYDRWSDQELQDVEMSEKLTGMEEDSAMGPNFEMPKADFSGEEDDWGEEELSEEELERRWQAFKEEEDD